MPQSRSVIAANHYLFGSREAPPWPQLRQLPPEVERRRRFITRALPLAIAALAAFIAGAIAGSEEPPEREAAERFAAAWARDDYAAMYAELNPASRRRYPLAGLTGRYREAQERATARGLEPGDAGDVSSEDGRTVVELPLEIRTVAFGRLQGELLIPFEDGGIAWDPSLVFPGLRASDELESNIELSPRAPIVAADGSPLAQGPADAREYPLGSAAIDVTGQVGVADPADSAALARQGYPEGTLVGISGLEQAFNSRLAGKPGGELIAVPRSGGAARVLASGEPSPGETVHTTIDPDLQEAAVAGLAGRAGGVAVLDARGGTVKALAGSAFSAPQPPGSTFKMITTVAALESGDVSTEDQFPITNGINVGGRFIYNAHEEFCGGSFVEAFADSCNAVFVPLGPKVGESKLVATAERFGFNSRPQLYDAAATAIVDPPESSIPEDVGDDLDLGVTAIGQGEVLATPLLLASVAQTIANGGQRQPTPLVRDRDLQPRAAPVRVTSPEIAHTLRDLMIGVVTGGTGVAAALPGVEVAGKTGTAELGPKPGAPAPPPGEQPEQAVDAWFAAFAPARDPRLAVGVMLIDADADGGTVAAPIARDILAAALLS
jgi:Penicillin binding protein transpeptidase domain/Penicillin-binding Protein dimerisation domain/NTF2-like N-terminal transpeptidase domain